MRRIRFAFVLLLVLTATACAPANRSKSAAVAKPAKQTKSATAAKPAAPQLQQGAPIVLGTPLPSAPQAFSSPAPGENPAPTGFGGLDWGASAKSNPGLAIYDVDKATQVTTCVWPQGPKDIAGAPIRDAFYEFYQDRFYHVWIDFDGMAAYRKALAGLTGAYGPPTEENPEKYYHSWSIGDVNIYCAYHPAENEGDVSFFYQPIYEPMMAAHKAAAAKTPPKGHRK
jgi:hypothetical protein